jgi:hypothetical protein
LSCRIALRWMPGRVGFAATIRLTDDNGVL